MGAFREHALRPDRQTQRLRTSDALLIRHFAALAFKPGSTPCRESRGSRRSGRLPTFPLASKHPASQSRRTGAPGFRISAPILVEDSRAIGGFQGVSDEPGLQPNDYLVALLHALLFERKSDQTKRPRPRANKGLLGSFVVQVSIARFVSRPGSYCLVGQGPRKPDFDPEVLVPELASNLVENLDVFRPLLAVGGGHCPILPLEPRCAVTEDPGPAPTPGGQGLAVIRLQLCAEFRMTVTGTPLQARCPQRQAPDQPCPLLGW